MGRSRMIVGFCAVIAFSAPTVAHADAPAIQAWGERARDCDGPKQDFSDGYRWLTGLHMAMYFAGAAVDPAYDLGLGLPAADATADEAAAAAGRVYLAATCDLSARRLAKSRRRTNADVEALAEAATAKTVELALRTVGEPVSYVPFAIAGRFVPTRIPNDGRTAHLGHFAFDPQRATRIAPPPAVDSDRYAASLLETQRLGASDSTERSEEESKATTVFDGHDPHPMILRILARRDLSLFEQARIMAIYDMAVTDGSLAQFAGKLHFQSWRPITAIRRADLDGRDDTEADVTWTPFLNTPNSSEYPCGHCTIASTLAGVLKALLPLKEGEEILIKGDDILRNPKRRGYPGDWKTDFADFELTFSSYDAFAQAASLSRIHNGAHFRYSIEAGMALGEDVAAANLERWGGRRD